MTAAEGSTDRKQLAETVRAVVTGRWERYEDVSKQGDGPIRRLTAMTAIALTLTATALASPEHANKRAICKVFGPKYCAQALRVAWCESRWQTWARNGQYHGLFQMGSSERRLFGHGSSARAQAEAAHRYFVASGRDWSPWTCRWAAYKERTYG